VLAVAKIMMCYQWERNEIWVWSIGGLILKGKTEVFGENAAPLSLCHHKFHMDCHGIEPRHSW